MAVSKSAEAFRTISEAANELDVPQHVLRHWEEVFGQIRPMRRAGGRRYYRPVDIDILRGVRVLLYDERYTTKGVQKIFKQHGVKYIAELGRLAAAGQSVELLPTLDDDRPTGETENPFRKAKSQDTDTQRRANGAPLADDLALTETGKGDETPSLSPLSDKPAAESQSAAMAANAQDAPTSEPPNAAAPGLDPTLRRQLTFMLSRLEKVQTALDDAITALDAIDIDDDS